MQILRLKQHYEKQRLEGMQVGKVPVEAPVGNILKGLRGIHGKGSYTEVVVGRGQEQAAEHRIPAQAITQSQNKLGGDQPAGDHVAGKGEETLIQ